MASQSCENYWFSILKLFLEDLQTLLVRGTQWFQFRGVTGAPLLEILIKKLHRQRPGYAPFVRVKQQLQLTPQPEGGPEASFRDTAYMESHPPLDGRTDTAEHKVTFLP